MERGVNSGMVFYRLAGVCGSLIALQAFWCADGDGAAFFAPAVSVSAKPVLAQP
jgi:hypothetical protein